MLVPKARRCCLKAVWLWSVLLILTVWNPSSFAYIPTDSSPLIWGKWKFIGYIYEGRFQDPPNPNLVLTFEFLTDGTDLLHWHRTNEVGICERKGRFTYDGEFLIDQVYWINPENAFECNRDPDMVLGKKQITPLRKDNEKLYLDLPLSEQTLTYVWVRDTPSYQESH